MKYLIIPKQDTALSTVSTANIRMDQSSRAKQYQQILELRRRPLGMEDTVAFARSTAEASPAPVIARPTEATPVTGITIIEASPDQAAELRQKLQDAYVVQDLPLSLIPPSRMAAANAVAAAKPWHLDAIGLRQARKAGFAGRGAGVVIAIADTGIEEVPEIQGRVRRAYRIDRTLNRLELLQQTHDTDGHGTHVAGLICGSSVGVAPDAEVENIIMIPGGSGNLSDFILAIEHVASQPHISILNMSAGIRGFHGEMQIPLEGLRGAGVLPVIAIGNEGRNNTRSPGNYRSALSIGASNEASRVAAFSGGGQMTVDGMTYPVPDCVAPGEQILSCVIGGGFEAWDGSSMATPIVSGLAALMIERDPRITLAELEDQILSACVDLGFAETRQGAGLIQMPASLVGGEAVAAVGEDAAAKATRMATTMVTAVRARKGTKR